MEIGAANPESKRIRLDPLTITLRYSSQDFSLTPTDSRLNTGTNPFDRGGVETFSYTGDFLCHTDQSVAFTFTPQNPTPTALVTANGQSAQPASVRNLPGSDSKED